VKENDRVFYFTTCGWMMWNWLVGSLSSGATILLFDGFPLYKKDDLLFEFASEEQITLFGISAKYIDTLAELLFAKGDIAGALENMNKALSIDPNNSYYKQQLWKFENTSPQPPYTEGF
jgi:tetratricopeptide (TPR) repeat protein